MALINRVTRMFRSDLHAVLDRIEEPEVLLKQAVREMQEAVEEDEQRMKLFNHERGQIQARQVDLEQSLKRIEDELDICFESGKDDLARGLIKRKLEAERLHKLLERKLGTLEKDFDELKIRLKENRSRLASMQQKTELFAEQQASSQERSDRGDYWSLADSSVSSEDVEVAFLREQQKRAAS